MGNNYVYPQNVPVDQSQFSKVSDLSNLKYLDGTPFKPAEIFGSSSQNLIPAVLFTTNRPQSAGQGYVSGTPAYGFDNRWPWSATDEQADYAANFTWVKGPHRIKAGFMMEHLTRNSGTYATYTVNGTYYHREATQATRWTPDIRSQTCLTGVTIQSYGQDKREVVGLNFVRYYQYDWFLQDSWKVFRRLTLDYGVRFSVIRADLFGRSDFASAGLFDGTRFKASQTGQLLFPKCTYRASGERRLPGEKTRLP